MTHPKTARAPSDSPSASVFLAITRWGGASTFRHEASLTEWPPLSLARLSGIDRAAALALIGVAQRQSP